MNAEVVNSHMHVYNVLVKGVSVGLTRSLTEAKAWAAACSDPCARIVDTGIVEYYQRLPS